MDCVAAIDEATFFGASAFVGALFDLWEDVKNESKTISRNYSNY